MNKTKSRPLRILVVTPLGKGGKGGIDRIMDETRQYFLNSGLGPSVEFVASRGQGNIVLSIPRTFAIAARLLASRFGGGPDVVHINLSSQGSTLRKIVIAKAARKAGVAYVIHLHGSAYNTYWDNVSSSLSAAITKMFLGAARIIVLGRFWRDYVESRVPTARDRIVILPNATQVPKPAPAFPEGKERNILFLGLLGERKGVPELLEAFGKMKAKSPWRAVVAGNGAVEKMQKCIAALGLDARVSLPGWVGPDDVRKLLANAHIVILPSHEENLPMSVIEGMAYGRAVVATPVGAVEDILHDGENGLIVPVGDAHKIAAALDRLVDDNALRIRIGKNARRFAEDFLDTPGYVRALVKIWQDSTG